MFDEYRPVIRNIARLALNARTIWNLPHENPDGDSIGCALAIHHALKSIHRKVHTFFSEEVPRMYAFLPGAGEVEHTERLPDKLPDVIFVSDNATFERLGKPYVAEMNRLGVFPAGHPRHKTGRTTVINIDHHPGNELYGDVNLVIPHAAATGEIVYAIFKQLRLPLPLEAAVCLYAAIITDTGRFSYSNTTQLTFEIATELVRAGVVPQQVVDFVYNTQTPGQLRLLGSALKLLTINNELGYFYSYVTPEMLEEFNCSLSDTEHIVETLKSLGEPKVCFFFKVVDDNLVKVSVRSRQDFDSSRVAEMFDGGGHYAASGFRFRGSLQEAIEAVEAAMKGIRRDDIKLQAG